MSRLREIYTPNPDLSSYVNKASGLPALDISRLALVLLEGAERSGLNVPITGDASLLVTYKSRDGVISSFNMGTDLIILQLQGSHREGYRVSRGIHVPLLFADEIFKIAQHPQSGVSRIVLPFIGAIGGMEGVDELALKRYDVLASRLRLRTSLEERAYIRDIVKD